MDVLALFARVTPFFLHVLATVTGESTVSLSCMEHVRVTVPPEYTGPLEDMDSSIAGSGTAWANDIEKLSICYIVANVIVVVQLLVCTRGVSPFGQLPHRQFPLLSISLCQLSLCQLLTSSIPPLSTLTKQELTKLELTKREVDKRRMTISYLQQHKPCKYLLEVTKQQMCMKYCSSVLYYQLLGSC